MREIRAVAKCCTLAAPRFSTSTLGIMSHRHLGPVMALPTLQPRPPSHLPSLRTFAGAPKGIGYFVEPSSTLPDKSLPEDHKPRMILVDAMALMYRSHFSFGPDHRMRTSTGEDTTVIFGFLSTLLSLLEVDPTPTHFLVVFDASGKTFRHELYSDYKGHRPETPEEIRAAIPRLQELLQAMGIAELRVPGVEADDVIGTIAVRGVTEGMLVGIASPDKDFFQLLRDNLILLRPPKPQDALKAIAAGQPRATKYLLRPFTKENFAEEWQGLQPSQFVDILALMGDSSDNVPGVEGIGPKTAMMLLLRYGSLDEILAQGPDLIPKRKSTEKLASKEGAAAALLSRQLVQIRTELDLPPLVGSLDRFLLKPPMDGGLVAMQMMEALQFQVHARRVQALWKHLHELAASGR